MMKPMPEYEQCFRSCQIRNLLLVRHTLATEIVEMKMTVAEKKTAREAFKNVVNRFLGNDKAENDETLIEELLECYISIEYKISLYEGGQKNESAVYEGVMLEL